MDHIQTNVHIEKRICHQAPFYVLGPLVCDIAAGYDHITGAIGGAMAAVAGADFLCYVTPSEHLGLPDEEDVIQGIMASRIAAHAADIVKGIPEARQKDLDMSLARQKLDWQNQQALAIDPERFKQVRSRVKTAGKACTMCGDFCAIELASDITKKEGRCF
jgi:phosphomethylpyrimidine synthase